MVSQIISDVGCAWKWYFIYKFNLIIHNYITSHNYLVINNNNNNNDNNTFHYIE